MHRPTVTVWHSDGERGSRSRAHVLKAVAKSIRDGKNKVRGSREENQREDQTVQTVRGLAITLLQARVRKQHGSGQKGLSIRDARLVLVQDDSDGFAPISST